MIKKSDENLLVLRSGMNPAGIDAECNGKYNETILGLYSMGEYDSGTVAYSG